MHIQVKEGSKERIQIFEVLSSPRSMAAWLRLHVRRISYGVGVEKAFRQRPNVVKVETVRKGKVRRASCCIYLRGRVGPGKAAKVQAKLLVFLQCKSGSGQPLLRLRIWTSCLFFFIISFTGR